MRQGGWPGRAAHAVVVQRAGGCGGSRCRRWQLAGGRLAYLTDSRNALPLPQAWIMPSGTVLCVDQGFSDWFGKGPEDCVGRPFTSLGAEQDQLLRWAGWGSCWLGGPARHWSWELGCALLACCWSGAPCLCTAGQHRPRPRHATPRHRLIETAQAATEAQFAAGEVALPETTFVHKYADAVPVSVRVSLGGTDTQRLLVVDIRRVGTVAANMMVRCAWLPARRADGRPACLPAVARLLGPTGDRAARLAACMLPAPVAGCREPA
jgi:hypothetical protein